MSRRAKKGSTAIYRGRTGATTARETPETNAVRWSTPVLWALGLVAATILAYQRVWHAGFIWDDDVYVTGNRLLSAPDGLRRIWFSLESPSQYFPLVYTTFRFEHWLWGNNPTGYHWTNILLHASNAVLVWRLLSRLRVAGAWFAAALFALHPVQVESVAWITERKNVLMGFFFLLALLFWARFLDRPPKSKWYWLALGCYALALFSKTTACTIPAALFLILWLKHEPITWNRAGQIAPFVALGIGMGLVTIWWERFHIGTQGQVFAIGLPERLLIASRAIWFYLGKLVWPTHLSFSYPHWTISAMDPADYVWLIATGALGVAIFTARRYFGRGIEVAALFFVATLSPMLGFIMLYTFRFSFVADHYQYLACIGPLSVVAAGMATASDLVRGQQRFLKPILCGLVVVGLAVRTWQQSGSYADIETLWRSVIAANPESWMAHNNLGARLAQTARLDEAFVLYDKALKLNPTYAEAYYNLGNAFLRARRTEEAMQQYNKALELEPRISGAHANIADILLRRGEVAEAIKQIEIALQINEANAAYHKFLADALRRTGRADEVVAHYNRALELDPGAAEAHYNLGKTLREMGREEEALSHFQKAAELDPRLGGN